MARVDELIEWQKLSRREAAGRSFRSARCSSSYRPAGTFAPTQWAANPCDRTAKRTRQRTFVALARTTIRRIVAALQFTGIDQHDMEAAFLEEFEQRNP